MAKDPAFLFYSSDFLTGTMTMNDDQVGKYIRLLCLQHQKGVLSEKDMLYICKSYDEDIFSKFKKNGIGFYNERLSTECEKRKQYSESRRKNRLKPEIKEDVNIISESYDKHMEDETIIEDKTVNKKVKVEIIFPFNSDNFKKYWNLWKDFKKSEFSFSYKSPISEQAALKKLAEMAGSETDAIAIIEQSMAGGWKGFFNLKHNNDGRSKQSGNSEANAWLFRNDPNHKNR